MLLKPLVCEKPRISSYGQNRTLCKDENNKYIDTT